MLLKYALLMMSSCNTNGNTHGGLLLEAMMVRRRGIKVAWPIMMMRRHMEGNTNEVIFFPSMLLNQNVTSTLEKAEKRDVEHFYDYQ